MAYATAAQMAAIVGADDLAAAAPDPDALPDAPVRWLQAPVDAALEAASVLADDFLRAHYVLPLNPVPPFLPRLVCRIAHADLVDDAAATDLIRNRAGSARATLKRIGKGELRLQSARTAKGRPSTVRHRLPRLDGLA